jgi:site-specific DNA-methyltransferase (adenine-specific)
MWSHLNRIIKPRGAVVITATQPFTSKLIMSNIGMFKYLWTWDKRKVGGFTSAKLKPLKLFEDVCVFSKANTANCNNNNMSYYPQGLIKVNKISSSSTDNSKTGYARPSNKEKYIQEYTNYPTQLIVFPLDKDRIHPTQKPIALMEYLIKTYTLEKQTVLDFTMGSGTTGVACLNTGRNFIGIEKDENYFKLAKERILNRYKEIKK